ncbi:hypothetical protein LPJ71_010943, partial [Coemansia sp. S17]
AFNSLYSYYWDVAFDWNLGHTRSGWKLADFVVPPASTSSAPSSLPGAADEMSELAASRELVTPGDALARDMYEPTTKRSFPRLLRPQLRFARTWLYYAAMAIDFLLRITWTMKLSSYIRIDQMAFGGFWLNVLEAIGTLCDYVTMSQSRDMSPSTTTASIADESTRLLARTEDDALTTVRSQSSATLSSIDDFTEVDDIDTGTMLRQEAALLAKTSLPVVLTYLL